MGKSMIDLDLVQWVLDNKNGTYLVQLKTGKKEIVPARWGRRIVKAMLAKHESERLDTLRKLNWGQCDRRLEPEQQPSNDVFQ